MIRSRSPASASFLRAAVALLGVSAVAPAFALAPGASGTIVTIPVTGTDDTAYAATVDGAGNVVMAGATSNGQSALAGITRTGDINPAFGGPDGLVLYNLSSSTDTLQALVRMSDGRYVGCGIYFNTLGTANDFIVARFLADGSLDTTFNGTGYAVTPFALTGPGGDLFDQCNAVAVDADGSIVAAGVTDEAGPPHVALARYTADGAPDAGFGSGGIVDINAASGSNGSSEAHALLIQPDGKLLVAGYATGTGNSDFMVMRLHADGTFDTTFGTDGIVRTPIGTGEDIGNAMVLQPDGRIVVAGTAVITDNRHDFAIARYTNTGALDPTFGTGGFTTTPVGPGDDVAYALTLMPWGRFIAAGSERISTSAAGTDLALVSYNADGTVDRFFGTLGIVRLNVSTDTTANDAVYALATDIDGEHFWAIGTAAPGSNEDFMAVEFGLDDTIFRHGFDHDTAP
ncbi:MAG TPA: delta-60 repeat domain-containing protein [Rhodanobacteraceae bacterium]|nr:delta-60 repeat domain-containing protein [Rhodanobacteraceae bacterium]